MAPTAPYPYIPLSLHSLPTPPIYPPLRFYYTPTCPAKPGISRFARHHRHQSSKDAAQLCHRTAVLVSPSRVKDMRAGDLVWRKAERTGDGDGLSGVLPCAAPDATIYRGRCSRAARGVLFHPWPPPPTHHPPRHPLPHTPPPPFPHPISAKTVPPMPVGRAVRPRTTRMDGVVADGTDGRATAWFNNVCQLDVTPVSYLPGTENVPRRGDA